MLNEEMYISYIKENMPRVLTQIDRDKDSRTYGSCDRNYWHLKIRDFSSAILQQTCLTLALAYKIPYDGNVFYKNEIVKEWAIAALKYMARIQLRDGSFNEYYPNEHGYPPTAFCLFAACKTYIELQIDDTSILSILRKSANWLIRHEEHNAYNQEIAAIAGLYYYYMITLDKSILAAVDRKVINILQKQSREGWFPEQGGADIGYSSVALDMLMEYYEASEDMRIIEPASRLVDFLSYFVHPDGTIGGEYGSRNTIYFMPNGLELFVKSGLDKEKKAKSMLQMIYALPIDNSGRFMDAVDERYLSHYVMHSYWRALQNFEEREKVEICLPFNTEHIRFFSDSGLVTFYNKNYYGVIGCRKGGVLKLFKEDREIFWDCGYRIVLKEGTTAATNWLDKEYQITCMDKKIYIKGQFNCITPKVQTPIYHLGLRISAFFFGDKVNRIVKKLTIFQNKHYEAFFEREICLDDEQVMIEDRLDNPQQRIIEEASNMSLRLVASGKFFSRSDLLKTQFAKYGSEKKIHIKRIYDICREKQEIQLKKGVGLWN